MSTDFIRAQLRNHPEFSELSGFLSEDEEAVLAEFEEPAFELDMSSHVVLDNIPIITKDKEEKLLGVLAKFTSQLGEGHDISIPFDEASGQSKGFCFLKCPSAEKAQLAIRALNGKKFTKTLVLGAYPYTDLSVCENSEEKSEEKGEEGGENDDETLLRQMDEAHERALSDPFQERLQDSEFRDQFVVRFGNRTQVFRSNVWSPDLDCVYDGSRHELEGRVWTYKNETLWSPQGTYLLTYHDQGVKVWVRDSFDKHNAFVHDEVTAAVFSPCEKFLVTKSAVETKLWDLNKNEKRGEAALLRTLPVMDRLCVNMRVSARVLSFPSKSELDNLLLEEPDPTVSVPSLSPSNVDDGLWEEVGPYLLGGKLLVLSESEMSYTVFRIRENIEWLFQETEACSFLKLDSRSSILYLLNDVSCPLDHVAKSQMGSFLQEWRERVRMEESYFVALCYAEEGRLTEQQILRRRRDKKDRERNGGSSSSSSSIIDTTSSRLHKFDANHKTVEFGQIILNSKSLDEEGEGDRRTANSRFYVDRFHVVNCENGEVFPFVPASYLQPHQDQNEFCFSASGRFVSRIILATRPSHPVATSLLTAHGSSSNNEGVSVDKIYVYDCHNGGKLLDSRSVELPFVFGLAWNPVYDILAVYSVPPTDVPAVLSFYAMPSRSLLMTKNVFGVLQVKLKWGSNGLKAAAFLSRKVASAQQPLNSLYVFSLCPSNLGKPALLTQLPEGVEGEAGEGSGEEKKSEEDANTNVEVYFDSVDLQDTPGGARRLYFQDFELENLIIPNLTSSVSETRGGGPVGGAKKGGKKETVLEEKEKLAVLYRQGRQSYVHIFDIRNAYVTSSPPKGSEFFLAGCSLRSTSLVSMHPVLEFKALTHLSFSPAGHTLCLVHVTSADMRVEFLQTSHGSNASLSSGTEHNFLPLTSQSQIGGKAFGWDPSGRLFTTVATSSQERKVAQDTGIRFWSLTGAPVHGLVSFAEGNLRSFAWRPRPLPFQLLAVNELVNKRSQLKKLERTFTRADRQRFMAQEQEDLSKKQRLVDDFFASLPDVWSAQRAQNARRSHGEEEKGPEDDSTFVVQRIVGVSSSVSSGK